MAVRCRICGVPALRDYVDSALNKGLSNRGIAAGVDAMGGKLDPDVVGRHKAAHWVKPVNPDAPTPTSNDLATLMRDKVLEAVRDKDPDYLLHIKDLAPMVGKGLQAQAMLDKREAVNKKLGIAAGALSLQMWLAGLSAAPPPPELDDGNTTEGEATEVEA